jgi:hypothetical protein
MKLFSCHPFWAPSTSPIYPVLFPLFLPSVLSPYEDISDRPGPFPTAFSVFYFRFTPFPLYSLASIQRPLSFLFLSSFFLSFSYCLLTFPFLFPPLPIFSLLFPLLPQFSFLMPFYLFFLLPLSLVPFYFPPIIYRLLFLHTTSTTFPVFCPTHFPIFSSLFPLFLSLPFPPIPSTVFAVYNLPVFLELLVQRNISNLNCRIILSSNVAEKPVKRFIESSSGQLPGTGNPLVIIPGVIGNPLAL